MLSKEEVRKHYIFTTKHELDADNKMLKQYIEQLEQEKEESYWNGWAARQNEVVEICKQCKYRKKYIEDGRKMNDDK